MYSPVESKSEYALTSYEVWITEHKDLECSADMDISIHLLNQSDKDFILNHLGFLSIVNIIFFVLITEYCEQKLNTFDEQKTVQT